MLYCICHGLLSSRTAVWNIYYRLLQGQGHEPKWWTMMSRNSPIWYSDIVSWNGKQRRTFCNFCSLSFISQEKYRRLLTLTSRHLKFKISFEEEPVEVYEQTSLCWHSRKWKLYWFPVWCGSASVLVSIRASNKSYVYMFMCVKCFFFFLP